MTNWEYLFGDCDKVARTHHEHGDNLSQCVRFIYGKCEGCRFDCCCDALDRYDASIEFLQEECE